LLKAKISSLEQQVSNLITTGAVVDGWTMRESMGRSKWNIPNEQVIELFGDDVKKIGVITPSQFISKKTVDANKINAYTVREVSLKLTVDNGVKAKEVFAK
jgi:hypothetical protein